MLSRVKNICLYTIGITIIGSELINYFYVHKYLDDRLLQWRIAMYATAIILFLFSLYVLLTEMIKKKKTLKLVFVGWMTIFLLINLIGVCLGYNLHSKGFMAMLFVTMLFGIFHFTRKLWQKCY